MAEDGEENAAAWLHQVLLCCNNCHAASPSSFSAVKGVDGRSEPGKSRSNNGKEPYVATTNTFNKYPDAHLIIVSLKTYCTRFLFRGFFSDCFNFFFFSFALEKISLFEY